MDYFIIAGEASGDLQGAQLMKHLKEMDQTATFRCFGGEEMRGEGAQLLMHYRELAFMGLFEVMANLGTISRAMYLAKKQLREQPPDVLILVDYGGFNLRIAPYARTLGIPVFYFISPKLWAWNTGRVKKVKSSVDRMFVILPFEVDFYARHGYQAEYVGNPLADKVNSERPALPERKTFLESHGLDDRPIIALLPGSRIQEVKRMLPLMASLGDDYTGYQLIVAGTPVLDYALYENILKGKKVRLLTGQTYAILQHATAALVTSGTATLETALFHVPQVVCYSTGRLTYLIGRPFVRVKYISLVNLIMNQEVVKELIQHDLTVENLKKELDRILPGTERREKMMKEYEVMAEKMGAPGAGRRLAQRVMESLLTYPETKR